MANNNAIIALIIIMGLLLVVTISIPLFLYKESLFGGNSVKSDVHVKKPSNIISFEDRINATIGESDKDYEGCIFGVKSNYENKKFDLAMGALKECNNLIIKDQNEVNELEKYASSFSDRREIEVIRHDLDIGFTAQDLIKTSLEMALKGEDITERELKEAVSNIESDLYFLQTKIDMLENYKDTYYYQTYLGTPEAQQAINSLKTELKVYSRLFDQLVL